MAWTTTLAGPIGMLDAVGAPIPLEAGRTWVEYLPVGDVVEIH
jgi:hypothetical protein